MGRPGLATPTNQTNQSTTDTKIRVWFSPRSFHWQRLILLTYVSEPNLIGGDIWHHLSMSQVPYCLPARFVSPAGKGRCGNGLLYRPQRPRPILVRSSHMECALPSYLTVNYEQKG